MIESQYTANIHKRLTNGIYAWKVNDNYAGGVPDAFYRAVGVPDAKPLWVEYKFIKQLPKRDTTMIVPNLSEQQLLWLKQARCSGEQAVVIIGCEGLKHNRNPVGVVLENPDEWELGISTSDFQLRAYANDYRTLAAYITKKCKG